MPEDCRICGERVPYSDAIHTLIHTKSEAGVVDHYVCRRCYESKLGPLFE